MVTGTGANLHRRSHFGEKDSPVERLVSDQPITFDKVITMSNVGGAVEFGSVAIASLPIGDLLVLGGVLHLDIIETSANISDTFTPSFSLGTTATADNALATTDIDLLTVQTTAAAAGGVAPHQKKALDGIATLAGAAGTKNIDNNAGTKAVFLNLTIPDAMQTGAATVRVRGSIRLAYAGLGKNS